jgi:tetratricopeptide (TPR) repeat protein
VIVGAAVTIVALLFIGGQNRGGPAAGPGLQPVSGQRADYQQLIQAAQRQLLQNPGDQQTIVRLANLYFDEGTEQLARNNVQSGIASLNQAISYYERALEADPESPELRTDLGTAYNRVQRKEEAIAEFMKVLEYRPDFLTAMFNLGVVHHQMGNTSAAREWYQKAAEAGPGTTMGEAARERLSTLPPQ